MRGCILRVESDRLLEKWNSFGGFVNLRKGHAQIGERGSVLRLSGCNFLQELDCLRHAIDPLKDDGELICGLRRAGLLGDGMLKHRQGGLVVTGSGEHCAGTEGYLKIVWGQA